VYVCVVICKVIETSANKHKKGEVKELKGESCQGRNKEYIYVFLGKEKIGKIEKLATHPKKKTEN